MTESEALVLEIPSEPEYVGTARLFLTAAGRHFELGEEVMADLKMIVSEVCAGAIEDPSGPERLRIGVNPSDQALEVEVVPLAPAEAIGASDKSSPGRPLGASTFEERLRGPLVQALFPDADYQPELHSLRVSAARDLGAASNPD